jgi:hypothetical protein
MIQHVLDLVDELRGDRARFHPAPQQETRWGIVLRFLGWPCEFATPDAGCAYPGLGWRCGHQRRR